MGKPAGCRICGRILSFHQLVSGQLCDNWGCKSKLLEKDMSAYRRAAAGVCKVRRPDSYPMVVVPDYTAGIVRQQQIRVQKHINFLFDLCLKNDAGKKDADVMAGDDKLTGCDPPDGIESKVCGVCKGRCCQFGKEHAFLNDSSMRRFMRLSGLSDPLDIVYAYFGYLPGKAVMDACVYQGDRGCTLPRWMRGDMCNAYRCKGLSQIYNLIRFNRAGRVFVVVRIDKRITRAAFVTRDTIRH